MKAAATVGVIGGSGLYEMTGFTGGKEVRLSTPFGKPSDAYVVGKMAGKSVAFLARHGRGHTLLPSEINYRANIYGFKTLGVTRLISVSAVGSMREGIHPMDMVFPDQFFDRTRLRPQTFFGKGVAAHIAFSHPVCGNLHRHLYRTAKRKFRAHGKGAYLCIEGPQFSTLAESEVFRSWKVSVIGMTNLPEARLAREAQICYATVALVTDYDCWKRGEEPVDVTQLLKYFQQNNANAHRLLHDVMARLPEAPRDCPCRTALRQAVLTDPKKIPASVRQYLKVLSK